jgi:alpha-galactosidase/6-phospho-beta-glucosidase family protein
VTDTIVRAALKRSRGLVREAAERDPTITDKAKGVAALDECLAAHADVLPAYL